MYTDKIQEYEMLWDLFDLHVCTNTMQNVLELFSSSCETESLEFGILIGSFLLIFKLL